MIRIVAASLVLAIGASDRLSTPAEPFAAPRSIADEFEIVVGARFWDVVWAAGPFLDRPIVMNARTYAPLRSATVGPARARRVPRAQVAREIESLVFEAGCLLLPPPDPELDPYRLIPVDDWRPGAGFPPADVRVQDLDSWRTRPAPVRTIVRLQRYPMREVVGDIRQMFPSTPGLRVAGMENAVVLIGVGPDVARVVDEIQKWEGTAQKPPIRQFGQGGEGPVRRRAELELRIRQADEAADAFAKRLEELRGVLRDHWPR